ncbi:terminase gpA endonuclease subunit [Sphingomonas sp. YL-JM2C]
MSYHYRHFDADTAAILRRNARSLDRSTAEGLRPPPRMDLSAWAPRYRRFPDDAPLPGAWKNQTAPELVEIMDAMAPHDPCEEADLIKCAQSGGTAVVENWIGFISDLAPGPMLFVQATIKAAIDWAAEKFWPMVEATPRLNPDRGGTIRAQAQADGKGSTTNKIKFARSNGYVLLAGASSAAGLRQRTVRYAVEDDLDQFPDDLDGQGSPEAMVDQRLKVYRSRGLSKRIKISTPTIKGASKIDAAYQASDRRRYYLKCPACEARFVPEWEDIRWPDGQPDQAYLHTPCCEQTILHWQKAGMKLPDGWLSMVIDDQPMPRAMDEESFQAWRARMPQSRRRGFHLTGLITSFQTWADMAVDWVAAQGDANKLKAWFNLVLGYVFELKGGQPDYEKLKALREQHWGRDQMPVGPIVATVGGDVQADGIYAETAGWADHGESWCLDARFLPGATDVPGEGAWAELEQYCRRKLRFPGGREIAIDQICVDAGYHTAAAQAFCARAPNRLPVFGRAGWTLPVLGRGEQLRYERQGGKSGKASKRAEDKAYIVGTFGVKLSWYGYLRSTIKAAATETGEGLDEAPYGRCHFGRDTPDEWFEHVTSEAIVSKVVNGYPRREWQPMPGRANHWLDCRVYNIAAAEKLMLDTLGEGDWARLRAERCSPVDERQGDLLDGPIAAPAAAPASAGTRPEPEQPDYIDTDGDYLT